MTVAPDPSSAAVVLVSPTMPVLPAAALPALREARVVCVAADVPDSLRATLDVRQAPAPEELTELGTVVLITTSSADPGAAALVANGATVIDTPTPALSRAATIMDDLRSPGGCPWDAVQTHDSLRRYLIEETYELLEAIEQGDRTAMREELGDVLLQVLFHARIAAEHDTDPFNIDEVADELVTKLVSRHPHVFGPGERVHSAEDQQMRWEELKQTEKDRESVVDGVALGQPAAALAGKLGQRTGRSDLPDDLFPSGDDPGASLFRIAARARRSGTDPEEVLRATAKEFAQRVRQAEHTAGEFGVASDDLGAAEWRRFWPPGDGQHDEREGS